MSWKNVLNAREKEIIEFQIKFNHRNTQNEIRFIKIYDFFFNNVRRKQFIGTVKEK